MQLQHITSLDLSTHTLTAFKSKFFCFNHISSSFPYQAGSLEFSIILGLLLGDGSLYSKYSSTAYYAHNCATPNYLYWLTTDLLPLMFTATGTLCWNKGKSWKRDSMSSTYLKSVYNMFYTLGPIKVKVLPYDLLSIHFTAASLAHWFMGDGTWVVNQNCILLCTDNFTLLECQFLCKLLWDELGIIASPNKFGKYFRIRVSSKSTALLFKLVLPYMHPDFFYKVPALYLPEWAVVYRDPRPTNQHPYLRRLGLVTKGVSVFRALYVTQN